MIECERSKSNNRITATKTRQAMQHLLNDQLVVVEVEEMQTKESSNNRIRRAQAIRRKDTTSGSGAGGTHSNNVIVHHGDLSIIDLLANLLLVSYYNLINTKFESYCLNKE
jgi:hypothetical protein